MELTSDWLLAADGDLAMARAGSVAPDAPASGIAFHAQQAIEKALKAILIWEQIDFPSTHDLQALLHLLPGAWQEGIAADEFARLTEFAVVTRHPPTSWNDAPALSREEAADALAVAAQTVHDVRAALGHQGFSEERLPRG